MKITIVLCVRRALEMGSESSSGLRVVRAARYVDNDAYRNCATSALCTAKLAAASAAAYLIWSAERTAAAQFEIRVLPGFSKQRPKVLPTRIHQHRY